jgi:putative ABC transport system substrate-binding protein
MCERLWTLPKLLEVLKQVAPKVTRLAVLRNSATPTGPAQFGIIQAMAPSLRVEVSPINVRDAAEIEQGINAFAHSSNDGLIVTAGGPAARHRDLIVALAARRTFTDRLRPPSRPGGIMGATIAHSASGST